MVPESEGFPAERGRGETRRKLRDKRSEAIARSCASRFSFRDELRVRVCSPHSDWIRWRKEKPIPRPRSGDQPRTYLSSRLVISFKLSPTQTGSIRIALSIFSGAVGNTARRLGSR